MLRLCEFAFQPVNKFSRGNLACMPTPIHICLDSDAVESTENACRWSKKNGNWIDPAIISSAPPVEYFEQSNERPYLIGTYSATEALTAWYHKFRDPNETHRKCQTTLKPNIHTNSKPNRKVLDGMFVHAVDTYAACCVESLESRGGGRLKTTCRQPPCSLIFGLIGSSHHTHLICPRMWKSTRLFVVYLAMAELLRRSALWISDNIQFGANHILIGIADVTLPSSNLM